MKKQVLFIIAMASAAAAYLLIKKCSVTSSPSKHEGPVKKHHLTTAFSKAKQMQHHNA